MAQLKLALCTMQGENKEQNQPKHTEFFLRSLHGKSSSYTFFFYLNAKKTIVFPCSSCDERKWGRWNKNYYLRSQQHKVVKRQCCWTETVKTLDKDETFSVYM